MERWEVVFIGASCKRNPDSRQSIPLSRTLHQLAVVCLKRKESRNAASCGRGALLAKANGRLHMFKQTTEVNHMPAEYLQVELCITAILQQVLFIYTSHLRHHTTWVSFLYTASLRQLSIREASITTEAFHPRISLKE